MSNAHEYELTGWWLFALVLLLSVGLLVWAWFVPTRHHRASPFDIVADRAVRSKHTKREEPPTWPANFPPASSHPRRVDRVAPSPEPDRTATGAPSEPASAEPPSAEPWPTRPDGTYIRLSTTPHPPPEPGSGPWFNAPPTTVHSIGLWTSAEGGELIDPRTLTVHQLALLAAAGIDIPALFEPQQHPTD